MYDSGIAIGSAIKTRKLETIIYKLKKGLELDEKEQEMIDKIIKAKEK